VSAVEIIVMVSVAVFATAVVLTRDPLHQVIVLAPFSLSLVLAIAVLQAPDVVLSAIVVGVFAAPIMVLLALAKLRRDEVDA
jgi:uncharacterized MnhB-related membrane protein